MNEEHEELHVKTSIEGIKMSDTLTCKNMDEENVCIEMNKKRLARKVWITRKARIATSERLKRKEKYLQIINVYYSLFIASLSIWSLIYKNDDKLISYLLLIVSISLTVFSIFWASRNYQERYIELKNNYISLDRLYYRIESMQIKDVTNDKLNELHDEYCRLIEMVENHSEYDYISAIMETADEKKTYKQFSYYLYSKIINVVTLTIIFVLPIILVVYFTKTAVLNI